MYQLNPPQMAWLRAKSTTANERMAFLRKGPVEAAELIDMPSRQQFFAPRLRGLRIGDTRFGTEQEALASAQRTRDEWQALTLPTLDEHALGIDADHSTVADDAYDLSMIVDRIWHLGTVLHADYEAAREFIDEFVDHLDVPTLTDLQGTLDLPKRLLKLRGEDRWVEFVDLCVARGTFGFLVQARQPIFDKEKHGAFSWGHTTSRWFYAESFEEAWAQAKTWGGQRLAMAEVQSV